MMTTVRPAGAMFFWAPAKMMPYLDTSTGRERMSEDMSHTMGTPPGLGDVLPLGAVDGVVGAVVEVAGLGIQLQLVLGGDIGVVLVGGGGGQVDLAVLLGLLIGDVGEVAGDSVVGLAGACR